MRRRDRRELERLLEAATRAGTPEELQGLDAHRLRSPGRRLPPARRTRAILRTRVIPGILTAVGVK